MSHTNAHRTRTATITAIACLCAIAPPALGAVRHDVVAPPGVTGCDPQPQTSDEYPSAALPAAMRYRASSARVRGLLHRPTQYTKATVHAYLPGGRRIDVGDGNEYTCTGPATRELLVFRVDHHTFGAMLARRHRLRLTVVMRLLNASGRRTTLTRVVTVSAE